MRREENRFCTDILSRFLQRDNFSFFEGGWMDEVTGDYLHGELKKQEYKERINSIKRFERQLTDNGYLVMKFFFHIGKKEQKKRMKELLNDARIQSGGYLRRIYGRMKHYDECKEVFDEYLEADKSA